MIVYTAQLTYLLNIIWINSIFVLQFNENKFNN